MEGDDNKGDWWEKPEAIREKVDGAPRQWPLCQAIESGKCIACANKCFSKRTEAERPSSLLR